MTDLRFARNESFFGKEGQKKIRDTTVAIVGVGGIGTHLVQQLTLLGVWKFVLVEPEELDHTNKNRYVGHRFDDPIPGTPKLLIAERMIRSINEDAEIVSVKERIEHPDAQAAVALADVVFGCLDDEGPRFILNDLCGRVQKPFFDCASEILPGDPLIYGGEVFIAWERPGCLVCCGVLDMEDAMAQIASPEERANRDEIYGVNKDSLEGSGPSVVSINGVVASLATTEFMVAVTGLRAPKRHLIYRGHTGGVSIANPESVAPCFICAGLT